MKRNISEPTPYSDVNAVLHELLSGVQNILGKQFVGMYLGGSIATGDFDPISPKELRQAVLDILHRWWAPILRDPGLPLNSPGYRTYAVLTMCRMLYTLQHGAVVSKSVAARWAQEMLGEPRAAVIERALLWEQDAPPVDLSEALDLIQYTVQRYNLVR